MPFGLRPAGHRLFALALFLLLNPAATVRADTGAMEDAGVPGACRTITGTGHPDYPPFAWAEGDRVVGANIDFVEAVAGLAGVQINFRYGGPWKRAQAQVAGGTFDLMASIYQTEDRDALYVFTAPILYEPVVVAGTYDRPFEFRSLDDLKDLQGATVLGEHFTPQIDAFLDAQPTLQRAENTSTLVRLLANGRIDYAIHGKYPLMAYARAAGVQNRIDAKSPALAEPASYIAFSRKSPCDGLAEEFSHAIAELNKTDLMQDLIERNTKRWSERRK